ncbi:BglG family transcription antiterminator [Thermoactinomyces sp. CICC 10523]|uniref:BglG family transcription antiterminator n=1 Tax=Thermoactinomyces sp. CICC 10523 TaxID=2767428 RepID=UPI0018DB56F7|nr:BglG family transcription antiterminator [Thermoactinomyces sp. CICC 10523]MBH8599634.1 BglG family transcription antiterminator [Thermoactinomyces sp. CICC 10523]
MPSDRYKKILNELTSNPSITSIELEKKYNLTRRQLGYSIDKINDWLMINNLPVIERTRKGHFVIAQSVLEKLGRNLKQIEDVVDTTILTEEQRVQLIILMLLSSKEELSLNHFVFELGVSKNTILSDLKQAQSYLDKYDLNIRYSRKHGYLLEGKEFQIRKLLIEITNAVLQMTNGEDRLQKITGICSEQVNDYIRRIEKVENKLNQKFTDEKLKAMPYVLILVVRRIEQGHIINPFAIKYEELSDTKEYKATEEILHDTDIPVTERLFITLHLLTTNVFSSQIANDERIPNLVPAIDNMLRHFEKSACIHLQDRDQLLDKLLQHIKPAYYRIKYQLTNTVVFQGSLSKEFKELHHLVKRSIGPLEELIGTDIPENEIAFITMLIGGWMKRQGESIEKKVKAIVVCPQGVSVSRIMFNELRELFPEFIFLDFLSVRQFLHYPLDYDVVFAPIYLETEKKLFVTKAFLGDEEKYQLRKQVMLAVHGYIPDKINIKDVVEIIKKYSIISDESALIEEMEKYFNKEGYSSFVEQNIYSTDLNLDQLIIPENITLIDSVDSWEEAIRISAEPLIRSGKIKPKYVDAMIRYCEKDPYIVIGPNMAIPHAAPEDGANNVGMSLLRVKDGVRYLNNYNINLIIAISAVDKHQHIHALMQLINLAGYENERNKLINAESIEEVYEIVRIFSKDY